METSCWQCLSTYSVILKDTALAMCHPLRGHKTVARRSSADTAGEEAYTHVHGPKFPWTGFRPPSHAVSITAKCLKACLKVLHLPSDWTSWAMCT